jgi:hypothetical protein
MNIGDAVGNAIWLTGTETRELINQYKKTVQVSIDEAAATQRAVLSPVIWLEKRPGEERVPPVPDHIVGPDVRLLVGEAYIVGRLKPLPEPGQLTDDLDSKSLATLRRVTRVAYAKSNPGQRPLSIDLCDKTINQYGIEVIEAMLSDESRH